MPHEKAHDSAHTSCTCVSCHEKALKSDETSGDGPERKRVSSGSGAAVPVVWRFTGRDAEDGYDKCSVRADLQEDGRDREAGETAEEPCKGKLKFFLTKARDTKNSAHVAGDEEQRLVLEAGELRAKAVGVVVLLDVDDFFRGRDGFDGNVAVAAFLQNDQAAVNLLQEKIERDIAISHGSDGINRIRIAAANQITKLLIHDIDGFAVVEFSGKLFHSLRNDIADAAEFLVPEGIRGFVFKNHFSAFEHRPL